MAYKRAERFLCVNSLYICMADVVMGIKLMVSRQSCLSSND